MLKVKKVIQTSANYQIQLEDDETFDFQLVFDREEWVLQGESFISCSDGKRGVRYCQAELSAILKIVKELDITI